MRKLILVGLVLVVLLGAAFALALRNLDTYLTENRDLVAAEVASVLGRDVYFDSVAVSWAGGFGVRVNGLRVGDDPNFSKEDFLSVDVVDVRVKLMPALLGRVEVGRVILRAPRVFVTETADGLSTDSLGAGAAEKGRSEAAGGGAPMRPAALGIALLDMRDAALRYVDRTAKPAVTLEVEQLDMQASELGLVDPVKFEMSAALFGATKQNLSINGTIGPLSSEAPRLDITLALDPLSLDSALAVPFLREKLPEGLSGSGVATLDADVAGTLAELAFDGRVDASKASLQLGESFDKPAGTRFDLALKGTRAGDRVNIPSLSVALGTTRVAGSAQATLGAATRVSFDLGSDSIEPAAFGAGEEGDVVRDLALKGDVTLASAGPRGSVSVRSPSGVLSGAAYTDLAANMKLHGQRYEIVSLSANAFEGSMNASGNYAAPTGSSPRFDFKGQLSGMRIESAVQSLTGDDAKLLNGLMDLRFDVKGSGSGLDEIRPALLGNGELSLRQGVLKDFNPAGAALRELTLVPGLLGGGIGRVLAAHPAALGAGDTPMDDFVAHFDIRDGSLLVDDLLVRTREYVMRGAGRYELVGKLDFKVALSFGDGLSRDLVAEEKDLRYIRDVNGLITIPLALKGAPPKIKVVPDVSALAGNAAREAVSDAINEAIGKEVGGDVGGLVGGVLGGVLGQKRDPASAAPDPAAPAPAPSPPPATVEDLRGELLRKGIGGLLGGSKE